MTGKVGSNSDGNRVRKVCFLLPWFAAYRDEFFSKLTSDAGGLYELCVLHGEKPSDKVLKYKEPTEYSAKLLPTVNFSLLGYKLTWQRGLLREVRKLEPDAVVFLFNPGTVNYLFMMLYLKLARIPFALWISLWTRHELSSNQRQRRERIRDFFIKLSSLMVCYGSADAAQLKALGVPAERIVVAQNTINVERILEFDRRKLREDSRMKLGIEDGERVVLFVGGLVKEKCLEKAIEAVRFNHANGKRLRFYVIGKGPERETLERIAKEGGAPIYFEGAIFGDDLRTYFSAADMFLLTGDGGLAINEAMAYGLPVISPAADGTVPDLIEDGVNGYLLKGDQQEEIDLAVRNLLEVDDERLGTMGLASRKIIEEKATMKNMVNRFKWSFDFLISMRKGRK